jgi:transcription initiation factor TFIIH subunit 2
MPFNPYDREYEDEHSWEQLQEDEYGNLQTVVETEEHKARRRRLLSAAASARVRRGMIRYLELIVDLSRAAGLSDMRPVRSAVIFAAVANFVRTFFDENPLSQLGILALRNGVAERITELSSSPVRCSWYCLQSFACQVRRLRFFSCLQRTLIWSDFFSLMLQETHIERLRASLDTGGDASLQNGLDLALVSLRSIPPYGHREALILLSALSTCDPGNIMDTIKACSKSKVRISVVGLAAEVHVCRVAAEKTGGTYGVATSEGHLDELMLAHATPPPSAPGSSGASLVRMGFPAKGPEAPGAATFVGAECSLRPGAFACPRCKARSEELPGECHVCGLTLVSSPHLARSYHHLFPVKPFEEVEVTVLAELEGCGDGDDMALPAVEGGVYCYGCSVPLLDLGASWRGSSRPGGVARAMAAVLRCSECRRLFCLDCDAYIHEHLHGCPGCEVLPLHANVALECKT